MAQNTLKTTEKSTRIQQERDELRKNLEQIAEKLSKNTFLKSGPYVVDRKSLVSHEAEVGA